MSKPIAPGASSRQQRHSPSQSAIRSVAWPLVAVLALLLFRAQIASLFTGTQAKEVSIAHVFTMKLEQAAKKTGNPKLAEALKGLSAEARKLLLQMGSTYNQVWFEPYDLPGAYVISDGVRSAAP
jgi:hypothetical protein